MSSSNSAPATKADLTLAIGDLNRDLNRKIDRVAMGVVQNQADIREMKEVMATKSDIDRVLEAIDSFAGKTKSVERAVVIHGQALTEIQVTVKDQEQRLKTSESRPPR